MGPRTVLLIGVAICLGGLATYGVVLTTAVLWPASLGTLAIMTGLFIVGAVLVPARATFRAGRRIWENDGLP